MNWESTASTVAVLMVFAMFVTSLIEVIKGISAIGVWGLLRDIWGTLIHNAAIQANSFPVLNYAIALLFCWAFEVNAMARIFGGTLFDPAKLTPAQAYVAHLLDFFATASVVYTGSDKIYQQFLKVKTEALEAQKQVSAPG